MTECLLASPPRTYGPPPCVPLLIESIPDGWIVTALVLAVRILMVISLRLVGAAGRVTVKPPPVVLHGIVSPGLAAYPPVLIPVMT